MSCLGRFCVCLLRLSGHVKCSIFHWTKQSASAQRSCIFRNCWKQDKISTVGRAEWRDHLQLQAKYRPPEAGWVSEWCRYRESWSSSSPQSPSTSRTASASGGAAGGRGNTAQSRRNKQRNSETENIQHYFKPELRMGIHIILWWAQGTSTSRFFFNKK